MVDRLPPLTALRAFDAAARHMSFAKAADELHVTPAALSFQIKNLEEHLGQPLFRRLNRAVELTEAGRALAPGTEDAFARLARSWSAALRVSDQRTLTVTAGPAFTSKWLAPRMFQFAGDNPDIDLRFSASLRIMDFDRDEIDVAIRFGQGEDQGLVSHKIIEEWSAPMVTPELAEAIKTPEDLARVPLLHQDDTAFLQPARSWAVWFEEMGVAPPTKRGVRFSQADHAINAALSGAGALLGRVSLAERHLRAGQLVMPFAESLWLNAAYRIVHPPGSETRPQVARFISWIEEQTSVFAELQASRIFLQPNDG